MIRSFCWVALLVLTLGIAPLAAQDPPSPTFHATPASPAPGQAFQGTLTVYAHVAALGVASQPDVSGNTITVSFDFGCGFICPGEDYSYRDFTFPMPALPAGSYVVRVVSGSDTVGTFPLIVGGVAPPAAIAAPALGLVSAAALAMLLLFAGLRRRNA
jgi:hypothetical protein